MMSETYLMDDDVLDRYLDKVLRNGIRPYDNIGIELALGAQKMRGVFGFVGGELSEFLLKILWGIKVKLDDEKAQEFKEAIDRLPDGLMRQFSHVAVEKVRKK